MQSSIQRDIFQVSLLKFYEKAKKKKPLFPKMRMTKKIFIRAAAKKNFLMNLIEFFK